MEQDRHMQALEREPIGKLLLQYSLPAIAGMVAYSLYNVIDSIFIGHGVGAEALSGLGVAFPIMSLVFALGTLVGIGGAAVCSITLGRHDREGAFNVFGNMLLLSIILGIAFGWGCCPFLHTILHLFGASSGTMPHAYDFMLVTLLGLPLTYAFFNMNHAMRASGYPRKAMLTTIITVVANVAFAPIFIFTLGWGMTGAAIATLLAQCVGLAWIIHHYRDSSHTIHFTKGIYRLRRGICTAIASIGMAPCLLNACGCIVVLVINRQLLDHGGDPAVGAFGVISRVQILVVMVVIGLTQGMQPIAGYNLGAGRLDRVRQVLRYGIIAGTGITTFGWLACELFPHMLAGMFTDNVELKAIAERGLRLSALAFPLIGAPIVIGNFFQSIGRARISIFLSLTRQMIFLVPLLLVLPTFWGQNGIWFAMATADLISSAVAWITLSWFFRRKMKSGIHDEEMA